MESMSERDSLPSVEDEGSPKKSPRREKNVDLLGP